MKIRTIRVATELAALRCEAHVAIDPHPELSMPDTHRVVVARIAALVDPRHGTVIVPEMTSVSGVNVVESVARSRDARQLRGVRGEIPPRVMLGLIAKQVFRRTMDPWEQGARARIEAFIANTPALDAEEARALTSLPKQVFPSALELAGAHWQEVEELELEDISKAVRAVRAGPQPISPEGETKE